MKLLNKLFGKKEKPAMTMEMSIEEYKKKNKGGVNIGQSIYPIFKRKDDRRIHVLKGSQDIIKVDILDDLFLCFNLDVGPHYEMLQYQLLETTNVTIDDLKKAALRNLENKICISCKVGVEDHFKNMPEARPFYSVQFDNDLNASIFLLDRFWETTAKEIVKSDRIAVSMPAKNLIYFSDMRERGSFHTMIPTGNHMYEASILDDIHLTNKTYIRKDGKWILYLDSEEQIAELW